jgi:peptide/nickel transport system permease protein
MTESMPPSQQRLPPRAAVPGPARRRFAWLALGLALLLGLTAVFADMLASDLPLALRLDGQLYLLPNLTRPAVLRAYNNQALDVALAEGDWALFPPSPWGQNGHDLSAILAAPSGAHWLGTDSSGRDVFARIVHGARVSLTVALVSVLLMSCIGLAVGLCAGYFGGVLDAVLMRSVDALHSVPTTLLILTVLQVMHPSGFEAVLVLTAVIGCVRWTDLSRLVRAEVLRIRLAPFVEAARALGLPAHQVILRHVLPNVLSPVLVAAAFSMAGAIVIEGALSFLGFGVPDDVATWGGLLNDVRDHIEAWWLAVFPGVVMFMSVGACNLLGEIVRDAIDPRSQT